MKTLPSSSPSLALLAPLVGLTVADPLLAAGYIKIGDIKGESTDSSHKDWSDISSMSWGIRCEVDPATGTSTGQLKIEEVTFSKYIDKSSPILMLHACAGSPDIGDLTMTFNDPNRNGGDDYIKITFFKVEISGYASSMSEGEPVPTESVSLNFSKITFEYQPADGSEPIVQTRDFTSSDGS